MIIQFPYGKGFQAIQPMEKTIKKHGMPSTDSIEELAKFWDAHDLTDFEEELEEVVEPVFVRAKGCNLQRLGA